MEFVFCASPADTVCDPNELKAIYSVDFRSDFRVRAGHLVEFRTAAAVKVYFNQISRAVFLNHKIKAFLITSIRGNETLLSKLKFKLPVDELDADLIEDVTIEMNQARETTNIYTNILDSTMETYASIINNNMASVMKQMTSVSIILMFPTLIASIFGMNLLSGMEDTWWGFPLVIVLSFSVTGIFYWLFRRKTWI